MKLPMFLKNSPTNTFEKYITSFLQNFSIDDQEKFDLLAFKNSKYLFTDLMNSWNRMEILDTNYFTLEKC